MKQLILCLLFVPLLSAAQNVSRFANDTLYTSCGYKIYEGQTLQFGKSTSFQGFRFITIKNGVSVRSLENNSIVVKDISHYATGMFGYVTIDVTGSIVYRDGSKGVISLNIVFDKAIGSRLPGTTCELILPEEFRITREKAAAMYKPVFENDTLYTSCGYQIYKGQVLQFGNPTGNKGKFRYVNIKNGVLQARLQNSQVRVKELRDFGISALGNSYITIIGKFIVDNKEKGEIEMHIAFDHAIGNLPTGPAELLVPEEFRSRIRYAGKEETEDQ